MSFVLRFLPCFLPYVLYIMFLILSMALCLMCYISYLVSCFLGFYFYLYTVDLFVFSLNIISINNQLYVELVANEYKYYV